MTNTTPKKLTWQQHKELGQSNPNACLELEKYASNADALHIALDIICDGFEEVNPTRYADSKVRQNIVELLAEADQGLGKEIKILQSI